MLALVQSNRLEALAEALAITLREQPLAPLAAEIIVVPSAGIGRWLGFELADRLGIIANTRFAFPASYVWSLFADVLPQVPRQSPFDPGRMIWRLMRLLGRTRADAAFASVAHYLASGAIGRRADLARALAARFDAYAAYRPEWLEGWLAGRRYGLGEHEAWQAILWGELAADAPHLPHIHPKEAFFSNLDTNPAARDRLPARISLFGVDSIAPLYLEIIERLGEYVDVVLYLLSPSREYWGHIVRPRTIARTEVAEPLAASYLESGNRLFASLGQHGRALFDALAARAPPGVEHFPAPDGNS